MGGQKQITKAANIMMGARDTDLEELAFPGVLEGWVHLLILLHCDPGVSQVHTQVAQGGTEHVLLGAVLQ